MPNRYYIAFDGPRTSITEDLDGPWPRWEAARAAAVEHLRDHVTECEKTLMCLRRAGSFGEYEILMEEVGAMDS